MVHLWRHNLCISAGKKSKKADGESIKVNHFLQGFVSFCKLYCHTGIIISFSICTKTATISLKVVAH